MTTVTLYAPATLADGSVVGADGVVYEIVGGATNIPANACGPLLAAGFTTSDAGAVYDPANVAITGGAIDGVDIGYNVPVAIAATGVYGGVFGTNSYVDASGTPGNATMNTAAGRFAIPAGETSVTITNENAGPSSLPFVLLLDLDANNCAVRAVVVNNGSFTVHLTAAPAGNLSAGFFLWQIFLPD